MFLTRASTLRTHHTPAFLPRAVPPQRHRRHSPRAARSQSQRHQQRPSPATISQSLPHHAPINAARAILAPIDGHHRASPNPAPPSRFRPHSPHVVASEPSPSMRSARPMAGQAGNPPAGRLLDSWQQ